MMVTYENNNELQELIIMEWKCMTGCNAECCGIVPIQEQKYKIFKRRIKKKIVEVMRSGSYIIPMTEDISCAFLSNNHRCTIYEHRPMICRLYGINKDLQCPYIDIEGNKRTDQEAIDTKELIKSQTKTRMDMIESGKI